MEGIRCGELHPLENAVVLQIIFEQLSVKDIEACRQVSKIWHDQCEKLWRSSVILKIDSTANHLNDMKGIPLREFLRFVKNESKNYFQSPFTHVALYDHSKTFWTLCGPTIQHLELRNEFYNFKYLKEFRDAIYRRCPNLVELTLHKIQMFGESNNELVEPIEWEKPKFGQNNNLKTLNLHDIGGMRISWMELLGHYPGLENLSLRGWITNKNELFRSINIIRQHDQNKLNIKFFEDFALYPDGNSELVKFLLDPTLNLETLCVSPFSVLPEKSNLVRILSNHAASLKKVGIYFKSLREETLDPYDGLPLFDQRQFEKLEELELQPSIFPSLTILQFTPNLRKLVLKKGVLKAIRGTDPLIMEDGLLRNCTDLIVSELPTERDLQVLIKWLPNIEKLEMPLNNATFALVCDQWPNLKSMDIIGSELNDSGITGLDSKDVQKVNKKRKLGSWRPTTERKANITSLKCLQNISIEGTSNHFDYCSAVCGFLQIPNPNVKIHFKNCQLDVSTLWRYGTFCTPTISSKWVSLRSNLEL